MSLFQHQEFSFLLKERVCPLVIKLFSPNIKFRQGSSSGGGGGGGGSSATPPPVEKPYFPICMRLLRVVSVLIKHFYSLLVRRPPPPPPPPPPRPPRPPLSGPDMMSYLYLCPFFLPLFIAGSLIAFGNSFPREPCIHLAKKIKSTRYMLKQIDEMHTNILKNTITRTLNILIQCNIEYCIM